MKNQDKSVKGKPMLYEFLEMEVASLGREDAMTLWRQDWASSLRPTTKCSRFQSQAFGYRHKYIYLQVKKF